jgi:V-type H+-transporting ATPase proteolipid subunit
MKSLIPVVMAGILGIYGMIVAVLLSQQGTRNIPIFIFLVKQSDDYTSKKGYAHMAAGLACGFSCIAAGFAIGVVGEAGVKANA